MAQPVLYQTQSQVGVDPTLYYTNIATAGGSVIPEYPAPPFIPGTRAFGSDGSEFLFVQASTSISLTDFVVVGPGTPGAGTYMANSITTTNVTSVDIALGATGLVLKQSVSYIPAGAMFWACTKGEFLPASTSSNSGQSTNGGAILLYTSTTPGVLTSVVSVASSTGSVAFAGFAVISSVSITIPSSVVPAVGTLTNGFTVGPVVSMHNPRVFVQQGTTGVGVGSTSLISNNNVFWL
jgi:hypothetical protein